jgi:dolichol kinase
MDKWPDLMKGESLRQLVHASGIFIVFLTWFLNPVAVMLICIAIVVFVELIFRLDKQKNIFFFSEFLRQTKRKDDERGFIYFFLGIILTLFLFQSNIAVANASIIMLLFGDSASTIFGRRFGRHKLPFNKKKTVEGSIAFIVVGFAGALTQIPAIPALFGAIFGSLTEAYSPIDDNIPIPIVSGLVMSLIIFFMG